MACEIDGIIVSGDGNVGIDGGANIVLDKSVFGEGPYTITLTAEGEGSTGGGSGSGSTSTGNAGVSSFNGRTGDVTPQNGDYTPSQVGAVPTSRTINGKALTSNITLSASDVSAVPTSRTINGKALTGNITLSATDVSAVPTSRTINGKALTGNISLTASDVSAVPTTRTINGKSLSGNISLTASDIGAISSTGVLPIANGGTGANSASNAIGNIISNATTTTAPKTSWYIPIANGSTGYKCTLGYIQDLIGSGSSQSVDLSLYAPKANPVFTGSVIIGYRSGTNGDKSLSVGTNCHAGFESISVGDNSSATGSYSIAVGSPSVASGVSSAAFCGSQAIGNYSFSTGLGRAYANHQVAVGRINRTSTSESDRFIVGKGNTTTGANAFRVTDTGTYGAGSYNSSGADYAEMFEWQDENILEDDRRGRFVTLDGDKIRLATKDDNFILGVVSGDPSVVGDVQDDQWQGMYLYDVFGTPIWEDVKVPDRFDDNGNLIEKAHIERRQKMNPDYNEKTPYIPRSKRTEWDAIGMIGKLIVIDDGSCNANEWCYPSVDGIATKSNKQTKFRVMSRIDDSHIKVLVL